MINFSGYDIWTHNLAEYIDKQGYTIDQWWVDKYEMLMKDALMLNIFGFLSDEDMQRIHRAICVRIMLESTEK